jgi:hypothetical protein
MTSKDQMEKRKMTEIAVREKEWWEHYPYHKFWCNDLCPLVPRFKYSKGDEWNANNWSLHWLIFHIWTLESFGFGAEVNLSWDSLTIGFILPYLRIFIGFHHFWSIGWPYKLHRLLRRRPAKKNENGEYN